MVATEKKTYETIYNQWLNETNPIAKETLEKDYKKLSYSLLLDENGKLNHFSLDNLHNKERVKRYYVDFNNWLVRMYRYTGHFIVNDRISHYPFTHSFQSSKMTSKEKREEIVLQLEKLDLHKSNNPTFDIESYKEIWRRTKISDKENGDLIVDAYELLGKPFIDNMGYNRPARLKKAIDMKKALEKEKQYKLIILEDIKQKYKIGQKIIKNELKEFLKELYRLNGIEVSVIQTTVQKYCLTTSNNSEKPSTYTITGYKS